MSDLAEPNGEKLQEYRDISMFFAIGFGQRWRESEMRKCQVIFDPALN
jgi:hypothetical protein